MSHRNASNNLAVDPRVQVAPEPAAPALESALDLDAVLAVPSATFIGECLCAEHPSVAHRALIRYTNDAGRSAERWLEAVREVEVCEGDRVLLAQPAHHVEPIITASLLPSPAPLRGVASRHSNGETEAGPVIQLRPDQPLRVLGRDRRPLLEVRDGDAGPTLRLLSDDLDLAVNGKLTISAESLELSTREGDASITAQGDVNIQGTKIRLN